MGQWGIIMKHINVMYTVDKNYFNYMLVSIYSFLENNKDIKTTFHIICDGLELDDYNRIERIINSFNNANIYFYDFKPIKDLIIKYDIPKWNNSYVSDARLFFSTCIKDIDNLLYLDSDTISVDSISGLSKYTGTIHMVKDSMPTNHWKNLDCELSSYYNSGVLWINIDKWNNNNCYEKIIKSLENKVNYTFPDQDLLNISLKDDIEELPPNYDLFSTDAYFHLPVLYKYYSKCGISRYSIKEMKNAKTNPIILHSTPFYSWRGWEKDSIHPYKKYYEEYFEKMGLDLIDNKDNIAPNEYLYRIRLYMRLMCLDDLKSKVKEYIKK